MGLFFSLLQGRTDDLSCQAESLRSGLTRGEAEQLWAQVDGNRDGVLERAEAVKLVLPLLRVALSRLHSAPDDVKDEAWRQRVQELEADLENPEAKADMMLDTFDLDGDGKVTQAEFLYRATQGYNIEEHPSKRRRLEHVETPLETPTEQTGSGPATSFVTEPADGACEESNGAPKAAESLGSEPAEAHSPQRGDPASTSITVVESVSFSQSITSVETADSPHRKLAEPLSPNSGDPASTSIAVCENVRTTESIASVETADSPGRKRKLEISAPTFARPEDKVCLSRDLRGAGVRPFDVDPTRKEQYLADDEFALIFGMSKKEFGQLVFWKREALKKKCDLW
jgi:hypothetical protein